MVSVGASVPDVQDEKRILAHLKKIPLFGDIGAESLAKVASKVEVREQPRRTVLYMPGDPGTAIFLIAAGRVKISKITRDGKELTLAYRSQGELFGEACLIDGGPREEMAEPMENTTLLEMPRAEFERLVQTHASLGWRMTKALAARRREVEAKIENLIFKDVNSKLAELLLRLGAEHGVEDDRGLLVALKITHQEMANLIGSTRETVSLTLAQFKKKGLVQSDGRKVILVDREGLRAMS